MNGNKLKIFNFNFEIKKNYLLLVIQKKKNYLNNKQTNNMCEIGSQKNILFSSLLIDLFPFVLFISLKRFSHLFYCLCVDNVYSFLTYLFFPNKNKENTDENDGKICLEESLNLWIQY